MCWFCKSGLLFYLWSSDLWQGYHLHHLLDRLLNVLGVRVALYLVNQVLGKLCILAHHIFQLRQLQDLLHNRMEFFFTAQSPSAIKAAIAASSTVAASIKSAVTTSAASKATSSGGCAPR